MLKKIILSILVVYSLLGFLVLPYFLKPKIVRLIGQETNSKLSIESVYLNPFLFKIALNGVELKSLDDKHLLSFELLEIDLEPHSLFKLALHVKHIVLENPKVSFAYYKDKTFNLSKIIKPASTQETKNEKIQLPRIIVDRVSIEGGSLDYEDYTIAKKFELSLYDIGLNIENIDTDESESSRALVRFHSTLGDGGSVNIKTKITALKPLKLEGNVNFEASKLYTQWRYIQDKTGIEVADGKLSFSGKYFVNIDDLNSTSINDFSMNLQNLRVKPKDKPEDVLNLKSLHVEGATIKPMAQKVHVEKIVFDSLHVKVKRDENGTIDWAELFKNKEAKSEKDKIDRPIAEAVPWSVRLDSVSLTKSAVNFIDKSLENRTSINLNSININVFNINSKENSQLQYDASLRVNSAGSISSKGSVTHTPLTQNGNFSIKKLSLKEFTPYLQESVFAKIDDGYLSLQSNVSYSPQSKDGELLVDGGLKIETFKLSDSRSGDTLVTFDKTQLKSFTLNLFPNKLYIDEVNLDSFYVDAKIDERKVLNFAKLSKPKKDEKFTNVRDTNSSTAEVENKFPIKIMKLNVSNGKANFSDFSLPIKFQTSIHDLNGYIYGISNSKGEISYIDIDGEVDKYGSTKLKGSLEPSNTRSFTDIDFNFRNLSLDSFSGYSAQFAGYKIEKGKLFLDLGYKISDSQLLGKNRVIIKSIELGDAIEDENITKLPLSFAIALLEDSDGTIDIDMPVDGNMDAPDFKYGALVLKTLGNLIIKAVASPFNFLGAAMGLNGDDLKYVEFEVANFVILPPEKEKLDNIAKILIKKPKLLLGIYGSYSKEKDKKEIQAKKLRDEVAKRGDKKDTNTIVTLKILEDIYIESAGKEVFIGFKSELKKSYQKEDIFDVEYQKALAARCIELQIVSLIELKDLAKKRALSIKEYLVQSKSIDPLRVLIKEVKEAQERDEKWIQAPLKIEVQ
ncbi:DUF748 domain-containing protein [Candidatus Sulfurimonas marisnigri]|uniref:DUF748 domain-containing protein n=1 Tax=Candidatus Sulfurimonas marisnigri TaxID=2740405 RepID=A0A7S7M014_9BACT|nr:DUF748 domain-containing protein [Candidatus Sulfurimonas marisnigri]QOY54602.1 DUF748 domain-containing protein [Candidatus Sulfurimonas marisnigri]